MCCGFNLSFASPITFTFSLELLRFVYAGLCSVFVPRVVPRFSISFYTLKGTSGRLLGDVWIEGI